MDKRRKEQKEEVKKQMIRLCQGQLEAYNQGDLLKFVSFYHPQVRVYRLSDDQPFISGLDQFTEAYRKRFAENPKLHCELKSRVILNETIIDEEWVTGVENQENPSHVVAIYKFKDDRIEKIWFTS